MVGGLSDVDLQSWTKSLKIPVVPVLIISLIEIFVSTVKKEIASEEPAFRQPFKRKKLISGSGGGAHYF